MDSIAAQRRLKAIHGHLAVDGDSFPQLRPNLTAGEFFIGTLSLSLSLFLWYAEAYYKKYYKNKIVRFWCTKKEPGY